MVLRDPLSTMSSLTHGGRIVPILMGHQQQPLDSTTTPETATLESRPSTSSFHTSLLDQPDESAIMRHKRAIDLASLEMPCLKERDLFALPTEGDGKTPGYSETCSVLAQHDSSVALEFFVY